jgi:phosphatidylglycerol---prolipoprotein diacylglyceryl transferase
MSLQDIPFLEENIMYPYIEIGSLTVETYHIFMVIGFFIAIGVVLILNKKHPSYQLPVKEILFLFAYVVVGALLGARLVFVITHIGTMVDDPSTILPIIINGGLVFYGGVLGGMGMGYLYIRQYGLDPIKYSNLFIVAVPLGHGCGRVGCFMAGCCHGKPTESVMGVVFNFDPSYPYYGVRVHPTQLYEATFNIMLFVTMVVLFLKFRHKHRPYIFVSIYLVAYGIFRFVNEFFRGDEIRGIFILSTSQWISLFLIAAGVLLYVLKVDRFKAFQVQPPTSKSYLKHLESNHQ